jgi:predicted negative regulator of RcsB-dependent stress response
MRRPGLAIPLVVLFLSSFGSPARADGEKSLTVSPVDSEPKEGQKKPSVEELSVLRKDVQDHPDDRTKRLALVRALLATKDKDSDGALAEAKAWRSKDAYNLVAVRALGDVYMERGQKDEAERVYSAIVELLPRDPDAQRALATLLKQRGDLAAAKARLEAALSARPDDARIMFELADVEMRLGRKDEAKAGFEKILAMPGTSEQVRYPTKLRLDQINGTGDKNDVHVYLTWDTDRTDVDLWVITPSGEKVFYSNKKGKSGEALYDDVTTGYGPESFTAKNAQPGEYKVVVDYFSARRGPFPEARGEVVVVTDEGKPTEKRQVLPYRLYAEKQNVTVAKITVTGGGKR